MQGASIICTFEPILMDTLGSIGGHLSEVDTQLRIQPHINTAFLTFHPWTPIPSRHVNVILRVSNHGRF